jgi:hypothetical protein
MVIKLVPLENKQSSQIGILEELAISLVAFLVPTNDLTGLIALMLATFFHGDFDCGLTLSQYQKNEHLLHRFKEAAFLPHPWHILRPSISVENCWTWSFNASK